MSKKILLIASSCFLFCSLSRTVSAQINQKLFDLPDSVCAGHEITPMNVVEGAESYSWSLCPPDLFSAPQGSNPGNVPFVDNPSSLALAQDGGVDYSFVLNANGSLYRFTYANGYSQDATETVTMASINNAKAMYAIKSNIWHVFVTANDPAGFRLLRYDFPNGLKAAPVAIDLGSIGGLLTKTKELYLAMDGSNWMGFVFTQNDEFIRLNFGSNLLSTPVLTNFGNINNQFHGASDITGITENGNWHLFVTNETSEDIVRLFFGNTLLNTPFAINIGTMEGRLKAPTGISITRGCNAYYAYVVNKGSASLVTLKWENVSIATLPVAANVGNVAGFLQPITMSEIREDSGALHIFVGNVGFSLSKLKFSPCLNSSIPSSHDQYPNFSYSEPGIYTVYLTINQGLPSVQTYCSSVIITPHSPITLSNDTLICQGDTINLSILTFGVDSFRWTPNYNISSIDSQFVKVWPQNSTEYSVTAYYAENCIVKSNVQVTVSEIRADAGPNRTIKDGSATLLGGANTTKGPQYTYLWTPDIGILGSTGEPVTKAIPPSNLTYYLLVSNPDGCKAIDSVVVRVPCDEINLPNAFTPESAYTTTNKFGISNIQVAKINYFKIFDRWGKEVFSTTDRNQRWDGKVDGKSAPMGVYVWEIDMNCSNTQERYRQSGTVTLIR